MMLKKFLEKAIKTFADSLTNMKDTLYKVVPKKDKDKKEDDVELQWWEDKPEDKKPKKLSLRDRIDQIKDKAATGPKPLPGSRRLKRVIAALSLLIYIGIIIFMLGENFFVEIFFVLTVYILMDYLSMTREKDIWGDK